MTTFWKVVIHVLKTISLTFLYFDKTVFVRHFICFSCRRFSIFSLYFQFLSTVTLFSYFPIFILCFRFIFTFPKFIRYLFQFIRYLFVYFMPAFIKLFHTADYYVNLFQSFLALSIHFVYFIFLWFCLHVSHSLHNWIFKISLHWQHIFLCLLKIIDCYYSNPEIVAWGHH